ncbi:unnamed protein product, partial [marine sediment metagenome]
MKLREYAIRRIASSLITLFFLSLLVFTMSRTLIDPVSAYVDPRQLDLATLERVREIHHLNDPLLNQYFYWLRDALKGDLG